MTRKDYAVIAEALARVKPKSTDALATTAPVEWIGQLNQWNDCVDALCEALRENPRFDVLRFTKACLGL